MEEWAVALQDAFQYPSNSGICTNPMLMITVRTSLTSAMVTSLHFLHLDFSVSLPVFSFSAILRCAYSLFSFFIISMSASSKNYRKNSYGSSSPVRLIVGPGLFSVGGCWRGGECLPRGLPGVPILLLPNDGYWAASTPLLSLSASTSLSTMSSSTTSTPSCKYKSKSIFNLPVIL